MPKTQKREATARVKDSPDGSDSDVCQDALPDPSSPARTAPVTAATAESAAPAQDAAMVAFETRMAALRAWQEKRAIEKMQEKMLAMTEAASASPGAMKKGSLSGDLAPRKVLCP